MNALWWLFKKTAFVLLTLIGISLSLGLIVYGAMLVWNGGAEGIFLGLLVVLAGVVWLWLGHDWPWIRKGGW